MYTKTKGFLFQNKHVFRKGILFLFFVVSLTFCLHPGRFASSYLYIKESDIENELETAPLALTFAKDNNKPLCVLMLNVSKNVLLYPNECVNECNTTHLAMKFGIAAGGSWKPAQCVSQFQVAIIIPFRNRTSQLHIFLAYMHPFLQNQMLNYRILVVEQGTKGAFNRAKLFNIGYAEALKIFPYHCFIFHDVDLIPQKLSNIYACTHQPRHMSSSLNTFRYNLPYQDLFGGAVAILQKQFELVNGFSNVFFGWGGEDDDFQSRINNKGLSICRFSPYVARYIMLSHIKEVPSESRFLNLKFGRERFDTDGVNTLKYTLIKIAYKPLYTWILVDL